MMVGVCDMLYFTFKIPKGVELRDTRRHLCNVCEESWFDDEMVKEMILDIDKTICYSAYNMKSPVLGGMNYSSLSGGVCGLILFLKRDGLNICSSAFGDNCIPWIVKIGQMKDITLVIKHPVRFPDKFTAICKDTGRQVNSFEEYLEVDLDECIAREERLANGGEPYEREV